MSLLSGPAQEMIIPCVSVPYFSILNYNPDTALLKRGIMRGRGFAAGCIKRLCKKVLKIDSAVGAEGCGIDAFGVDEYIAASWQQHYGIVFPPS